MTVLVGLCSISQTACGPHYVTEPQSFAEESVASNLVADRVNLSGEWVGNYGSHGDEIIRIVQDGDQVIARKVTGDVNVPAGKPTFSATIVGRVSPGKAVVADVGFVNPRMIAGRLVIHSEQSISFHYGQYGPIHFQKQATRSHADPP